jgi:hypothetical protein
MSSAQVSLNHDKRQQFLVIARNFINRDFQIKLNAARGTALLVFVVGNAIDITRKPFPTTGLAPLRLLEIVRALGLEWFETTNALQNRSMGPLEYLNILLAFLCGQPNILITKRSSADGLL